MKQTYKVIKANDIGVLEAEVNRHLSDGWTLVGGVSVAESRDQGWTHCAYAQAMIKVTLSASA